MTHVSEEDEKDEGCMSGLVRALEADNVFEAAQRLQQLHELKNFVYATVCVCACMLAKMCVLTLGAYQEYAFTCQNSP